MRTRSGTPPQALELACQLGYGVREGHLLTGLAAVHLDRSDHLTAAQYAERALDNHRHTGHRLGEARTHLVIGHIRRQADDYEAAHRHWCRARTLFTDIGAPEVEQADALLGPTTANVRESSAGVA